MKQFLSYIQQSILLSSVVIFQGCVGFGERSAISKPVGQLRTIPLKNGQVWSGFYDPDGRSNGGAFSMMISEVDSQGNFNGYMKTPLLLNGTGPISGRATGSTLKFTLQHAVNSAYYEDYNCSYSDQLRGTYYSKTNKAARGAFILSIAPNGAEQFMQSYDKIVNDERASLARSNQSRRSTVVYRDSPTYNPAPRQSFSDWENQHRQEELMERQTRALEQMQRDQSWDNFEKGQRYPWQQ